MIARIIELLDLVAGERLPATTRFGLAELQKVPNGTAPMIYVGNGWKPIASDINGTFSYWRLTDRIKEAKYEGSVACAEMFSATHSLRLVTYVDRGKCDGNIPDVSRAAASDMRRNERQVKTGINAALVEITGIVDTDTKRVYQQEFGGAGFKDVPPNRALIAIDLIVTVTGNEECFDVCGTPIDLVCAIISKATNAKVVECLGDRLSEICGGVDCPMDINVRVDGVLVETINDADPCVDNTLNINITYS